MHDVESPGTPTAGAQSVSLPGIRQAASWGKATDDLLAALEREEAEALAVFEKARERVKAARKAAAAMRQIRDLVRLNGEAPKTAPKPVVAKADDSARWSRKHDCCVNCSTTQIAHAAGGRCRSCETIWRRTGQDRTVSSKAAG